MKTAPEVKPWIYNMDEHGHAFAAYKPTVKHIPDAADAETVRVPVCDPDATTRRMTSLHPADVPARDVIGAVLWVCLGLAAGSVAAVTVWNWLHPVTM